MPAEGDRIAGSPAPEPPGAFADPTLIDEMLALTPEERLRLNDRLARTIQELRDGIAAAGPHDPARPAGRQRR